MEVIICMVVALNRKAWSRIGRLLVKKRALG